MLHALTLKEQLCTAIERHGLAEVLDRMTDLIHASDYANGDQIVKLLEDATRLALVQNDASAVLTLPSNRLAS
ncbi:hypothetical protein [Stenomitos frigidus]|uniref:Uncharacterized protein n=1 Tax=Stenomitos frigidus ULC18 TaxID=2107698 RepID=A0A2T1EAU7_9CYAN|nr:hypothetical protein [Stenomitos frigidus]PSB29886.1 hypothetical protein C7B82_10055 [Stenomitos frigidus ULC18]